MQIEIWWWDDTSGLTFGKWLTREYRVIWVLNFSYFSLIFGEYSSLKKVSLIWVSNLDRVSFLYILFFFVLFDTQKKKKKAIKLKLAYNNCKFAVNLNQIWIRIEYQSNKI